MKANNLRERKKIVDALKMYLNEPYELRRNQTNLEHIVEQLVMQLTCKPSVDDLLKLQRLLGEDITRIELNTQPLEIVTTDTNANNLERI